MHKEKNCFACSIFRTRANFFAPTRRNKCESWPPKVEPNLDPDFVGFSSFPLKIAGSSFPSICQFAGKMGSELSRTGVKYILGKHRRVEQVRPCARASL